MPVSFLQGAVFFCYFCFCSDFLCSHALFPSQTQYLHLQKLSLFSRCPQAVFELFLKLPALFDFNSSSDTEGSCPTILNSPTLYTSVL